MCRVLLKRLIRRWHICDGQRHVFKTATYSRIHIILVLAGIKYTPWTKARPGGKPPHLGSRRSIQRQWTPCELWLYTKLHADLFVDINQYKYQMPNRCHLKLNLARCITYIPVVSSYSTCQSAGSGEEDGGSEFKEASTGLSHWLFPDFWL